MPPSQIPDIRSDLNKLDAPCTQEIQPFELSPEADPLGVAWVLAGSHLGNRAMMKGLPDGADYPRAFLSDPRMAEFWRSLQPYLVEERPEPATAAAIQSAKAVFEHFLRQVENYPSKLAA